MEQRLILKKLEQIHSMNETFENGIFPSEMAFILDLIDSNSIEVVIESGRGLGAYSTRILNTYCNANKILFFSVDFQPIFFNSNWKSLREKNLGYSRFICGDAFDVIPYLINTKYRNKNILLVIDGPKGNAQLELLSKIKIKKIIVMMHNVIRDKSYLFYEDMDVYKPNLSNIKKYETQNFIKNSNHGRDLEYSTLGVKFFVDLTIPDNLSQLEQYIFQIKSISRYYIKRLYTPILYFKNLLFPIKLYLQS
jgi:hypothetical protein